MNTDVVRTLPYGNIKIKTVTGDAVDTEIELRPTKGFSYVLIDVWGFHDDGTNRSLSWTYHDGVNQIEKEGSGAIAAATPWHFNQRSTSTPWSTVAMPVVLKHEDVGGIYMTLKADALAAGKKLYIKALVYEVGDT